MPSDRAPIAVTQRGEADVKAAMRAQGSRDRSNLLRRCQSGDRGGGLGERPLRPETKELRGEARAARAEGEGFPPSQPGRGGPRSSAILDLIS